MEENVKSNNNNPSQIRIPPGFGKISDGLDREKVDTFAYQEQSKVQKYSSFRQSFLRAGIYTVLKSYLFQKRH